MNYKVCVVTVTYGNRFKYLKQVVKASLEEGVCKVIIVDNGSEEESKNQLKQLEKELKDKLKVIYLPENTGSAGGFKRGLEEAYKDKDCEFIWLLDDDNLPLKNSLKTLISYWNNLDLQNKDKKVALVSFRKRSEAYLNVNFNKKSEIIIGKKNSFIHFHILDIPQKIFRRLKNKWKFSIFRKNSHNKIRYVKKNNMSLMPVAPYGGLFFNKKIIETIGFPNENFFLYVDDHDWTFRLTKLNGKIYLVPNSQIKDLDIVIQATNKTYKSSFHAFLNEGNDFIRYYYIRNKIFFDKKLTTNKLIFNLNRYLFQVILMFYKNKNNKNRYKLIKRAIKDGLAGNLGKRDEL